LFLVGGRTFSQVHYSIEGSTDHEYEGRKVALVMLEEDNRQADSTNVVNGKFVFKGELLQSCWAAVCIDGMGGISPYLRMEIFVFVQMVRRVGAKVLRLMMYFKRVGESIRC
jgi:hypothetical protein